MGKNTLRHFPPLVSGEGAYKRGEAVRPRADHTFQLRKNWGVISDENVSFTTIHGIVFQGIVYASAPVYKQNLLVICIEAFLAKGEYWDLAWRK
jgi:hypothetical protein